MPLSNVSQVLHLQPTWLQYSEEDTSYDAAMKQWISFVLFNTKVRRVLGPFTRNSMLCYVLYSYSRPEDLALVTAVPYSWASNETAAKEI